MNKILIALAALTLVSCTHTEENGDAVLDEILSEQESLSDTISDFVSNLVITKPSDQNNSPAPIEDLSHQLTDATITETSKTPVMSNNKNTKNSNVSKQNINKVVNNELETEEPIDAEDIRSTLLEKARTRSVEPSQENLNYFCGLSSQLVFYIVNNIIMDYYNDGKNIKPGKSNGKIPKNFGMITLKNSFAYKALRINREKLDMLRDSFENSLPFDIDLFDDLANQYQFAYYKNCVSTPKKYIFNYNRIFKYRTVKIE